MLELMFRPKNLNQFASFMHDLIVNLHISILENNNISYKIPRLTNLNPLLFVTIS